MLSRGLVNTIAVAIVVVSTINNHEHFDTVPFYFHEKIIVISITIKNTGPISLKFSETGLYIQCS